MNQATQARMRQLEDALRWCEEFANAEFQETGDRDAMDASDAARRLLSTQEVSMNRFEIKLVWFQRGADGEAGAVSGPLDISLQDTQVLLNTDGIPRAADKFGVYFNHTDGTQRWVDDYDTLDGARKAQKLLERVIERVNEDDGLQVISTSPSLGVRHLLKRGVIEVRRLPAGTIKFYREAKGFATK